MKPGENGRDGRRKEGTGSLCLYVCVVVGTAALFACTYRARLCLSGQQLLLLKKKE